MNDFLDNLANDQHQKMLREIANDDLTPKKRDKSKKLRFLKIKLNRNHFTNKKL